ncbi:hypothetical protein PAPYR_4290 [Paratrimastix pyriformis]|uniref:2'-phosphotransferase n=1 Tax=Paratrimastix pyriformis TaxID=342808 RepID=A0ABQ8US59_9EUKA|nr:hypothetical protein PAPYR_4290 [Paratrimastix pyriformis]
MSDATFVYKFLVVLCRHLLKKVRVNYSADGWVLLDDVLSLPTFSSHGVKIDDVTKVIEMDHTSQVSLVVQEGRRFIRANWGHSPELDVHIPAAPLERGRYDAVYLDISERRWQKLQRTGVLATTRKEHLAFFTRPYLVRSGPARPSRTRRLALNLEMAIEGPSGASGVGARPTGRLEERYLSAIPAGTFAVPPSILARRPGRLPSPAAPPGRPRSSSRAEWVAPGPARGVTPGRPASTPLQPASPSPAPSGPWAAGAAAQATPASPGPSAPPIVLRSPLRPLGAPPGPSLLPGPLPAPAAPAALEATDLMQRILQRPRPAAAGGPTAKGHPGPDTGADSDLGDDLTQPAGSAARPTAPLDLSAQEAHVSRAMRRVAASPQPRPRPPAGASTDPSGPHAGRLAEGRGGSSPVGHPSGSPSPGRPRAALVGPRAASSPPPRRPSEGPAASSPTAAPIPTGGHNPTGGPATASRPASASGPGAAALVPVQPVPRCCGRAALHSAGPPPTPAPAPVAPSQPPGGRAPADRSPPGRHAFGAGAEEAFRLASETLGPTGGQFAEAPRLLPPGGVPSAPASAPAPGPGRLAAGGEAEGTLELGPSGAAPSAPAPAPEEEEEEPRARPGPPQPGPPAQADGPAPADADLPPPEGPDMLPPVCPDVPLDPPKVPHPTDMLFVGAASPAPGRSASALAARPTGAPDGDDEEAGERSPRRSPRGRSCSPTLPRHLALSPALTAPRPRRPGVVPTAPRPARPGLPPLGNSRNPATPSGAPSPAPPPSALASPPGSPRWAAQEGLAIALPHARGARPASRSAVSPSPTRSPAGATLSGDGDGDGDGDGGRCPAGLVDPTAGWGPDCTPIFRLADPCPCGPGHPAAACRWSAWVRHRAACMLAGLAFGPFPCLACDSLGVAPLTVSLALYATVGGLLQGGLTRGLDRPADVVRCLVQDPLHRFQWVDEAGHEAPVAPLPLGGPPGPLPLEATAPGVAPAGVRPAPSRVRLLWGHRFQARVPVVPLPVGDLPPLAAACLTRGQFEAALARGALTRGTGPYLDLYTAQALGALRREGEDAFWDVLLYVAVRSAFAEGRACPPVIRAAGPGQAAPGPYVLLSPGLAATGALPARFFVEARMAATGDPLPLRPQTAAAPLTLAAAPALPPAAAAPGPPSKAALGRTRIAIPTSPIPVGAPGDQ